jgi:hypothetical protein
MALRTYIFECSNDTFAECLERNLFGSHLTWPLGVKKGDLCFLYHYGTHDVLALWIAESDGQSNLESRAWNGRYRNQVRVKLETAEMLTVPRSIVNRIIRNPATERVDNVLFGDRAHNLIQFFAHRVHADFEREMNLSDLDRDYRRRYEATFICEDGHRVRSQGEMIIDNWFSRHRVFHAVEPILPNVHNLIPDFMIYNREEIPVFIEYWGMTGDPAYDERTRLKFETYRSNKLPLIGLKPEDLKNVDEVLRSELHKHQIAIPR